MDMRRFVAFIAALSMAALSLVLVGGSSAPVTAIVGGSEAAEGGFPFMASIQYDDGFAFCGGSIIAPRWVLTAAHCMEGENASDIFVVTGRTDLSETSKGQRIQASRLFVHPQWDSDVFRYDAALIELSAPTVSPAIKLAAAGNNTLEAAGTPVTVTGWGDILPTFGLFSTNQLRKVDLNVVSDAECRETNELAFGFHHAPTSVCAAALLKDSCQGDSGGPLFGKQAGTRIQIGIVSYGMSCALPKFPGIYSEVNNPAIRSWITTNSGV